MMSGIQAFPYDTLPQLSHEEVALQNRVLQMYSFFDAKKENLHLMAQSLSEILKTPVSIKVIHSELQQCTTLQSGLPKNAIFGVVDMEPMASKAVLVFESLLAKLLVHNLLSGGKSQPDSFLGLQSKPLTVLEEAIVQYVLIASIDSFTNQFVKTKFSLSFHSVYQDLSLVQSLYKKDTWFSVVSFQVALAERDFYLKLLLPLDTFKSMSLADINAGLSQKRLQQFGRFVTELHLEAGSVTLLPQDIEALDSGDIILFDESGLTLKEQKIQGRVRLKLPFKECESGYWVDVSSEPTQLNAKIVGHM